MSHCDPHTKNGITCVRCDCLLCGESTEVGTPTEVAAPGTERHEESTQPPLSFARVAIVSQNHFSKKGVKLKFDWSLFGDPYNIVDPIWYIFAHRHIFAGKGPCIY